MPNLEYDDSAHMVGGFAGGLSTEHAAAVVVLGSLAILILIKRGFRGINVPGVAHVNIG